MKDKNIVDKEAWDKLKAGFLDEIEGKVYEAIGLFEELENNNWIDTNGHHLRQKIAKYAKETLRKCFIIKSINEKFGEEEVLNESNKIG